MLRRPMLRRPMLRSSRRGLDWLQQRAIAHRGLHDPERPENSRAAFEAAAQAGYAIELDVRLSADGQPVVFHDVDLRRMTGRGGTLGQTRWADLSTRCLNDTSETIPSLEQVLEQIAGRVPILVELKHQAPVGPLERAVRDLLHCYRGECAVQSFDPRSMVWMRRHAPELPRGMLSGDLQDEDRPLHQRIAVQTLALAPRVRPDFIGYELWSLPHWAPDRLRRRGIPVLAWTVRDPTGYRRARKVADNVIFEFIRP